MASSTLICKSELIDFGNVQSMIVFFSSPKKIFKSERAYINSLQKYWVSYYSIRQVALYDFERKTDLIADFDKILNQ